MLELKDYSQRRLGDRDQLSFDIEKFLKQVDSDVFVEAVAERLNCSVINILSRVQQVPGLKRNYIIRDGCTKTILRIEK
ncbi:hypothetical protein M2139_001523 [Enterococcus sp. PF1-24]|nr:hypothetical protein [Enterococcus sp. PFB1-1]MDH6401637.1 hypothetical protein [Enterococcus sp. PF1-24]